MCTHVYILYIVFFQKIAIPPPTPPFGTSLPCEFPVTFLGVGSGVFWNCTLCDWITRCHLEEPERAIAICVSSHKIVGFSNFYDVNVAKNELNCDWFCQHLGEYVQTLT